MNNRQIQRLKQYITELEEAIQNNDESELFALFEIISSRYRSIPGVIDLYNSLMDQSRLVFRFSKALVGVLEEHIFRCEIDLDNSLSAETMTVLSEYPASLQEFKKGMKLLSQGGNERVALDSFRVALESFLKELLQNNNSLEKQKPLLGQKLAECGVSPAHKGLVTAVFYSYIYFQNEAVKHPQGDLIDMDEAKFVFELTCILINHIHVALQ